MASSPLLLPLAILALQGLFLAGDEIVFHWRRGLPLWERLGHPLDTFTVLIGLGIALFAPPSAPWTSLFLGAAILSCLCVTKDEWVHARLCSGGESWAHAVLFLLHPLLFWAVYLLWKDGRHAWLFGEALLCGGFFLYQIVYWNLIRRPESSLPSDSIGP